MALNIRTPKVGDRVLIRDGDLVNRPWIVSYMRPFLGTIQTISCVSRNGRVFRIEGLDGCSWNTNIDIKRFIDEPEPDPPSDDELNAFIGS